MHRQISERYTQKYIENKEEFKNAIAERKHVTNLLEQDKKQELEKKLASLDYGKELLKQVDEVKTRRRFERQHEKELTGNIEKEQQECDDLINSYISNGNDILPQHPNYRLMKHSY